MCAGILDLKNSKTPDFINKKRREKNAFPYNKITYLKKDFLLDLFDGLSFYFTFNNFAEVI